MKAPMTVCLSVLATLFSFSAKAATFPQSGQALEFEVIRNGDPIGSHSITFETKGAVTTVDIKTDIVVKVLMVPVYRFEHRGHEVWQDGRLVLLDSTTNDDGTPLTLHVAASRDGLDVRSNATQGTSPLQSIPGSLWNPAAMAQTQLLNSLNGKLMAVNVSDLGETSISVRGQPTPTRHFTVEGELQREIWYAADGSLAQMRFKGKDDSDILYRLR